MSEIIIDGCNVAEERKFLIHTDRYSIGEDGLIDGEIPFTDICYDLALQLQRLKDKLEKINYRFKETKKANKRYKKEIENLHKKMSDVIYRATGGRLSYSTYTLDAIEQAFQDQLEILSDRKAEDEIEQYKKSKQASYEAMQREWNAAINEYRKIILENEKLKKEVETWSYQAEKRAEIGDVWYDTALKYKQALEEVEKYCNECNLKADYTACEVLKIINEVLND